MTYNGFLLIGIPMAVIFGNKLEALTFFGTEQLMFIP